MAKLTDDLIWVITNTPEDYARVIALANYDHGLPTSVLNSLGNPATRTYALPQRHPSKNYGAVPFMAKGTDTKISDCDDALNLVIDAGFTTLCSTQDLKDDGFFPIWNEELN